jgi:prepilin-type N-terminal cleavage/methylation domain-containing protein
MQKGFAFIELMIVIAVVGLLGAIAAAVMNSRDDTSCKAGYLFAHGHRGHIAQVIDAQGHGIPCK